MSLYVVDAYVYMLQCSRINIEHRHIRCDFCVYQVLFLNRISSGARADPRRRAHRTRWRPWWWSLYDRSPFKSHAIYRALLSRAARQFEPGSEEEESRALAIKTVEKSVSRCPSVCCVYVCDTRLCADENRCNYTSSISSVCNVCVRVVKLQHTSIEIIYVLLYSSATLVYILVLRSSFKTQHLLNAAGIHKKTFLYFFACMDTSFRNI